MNVIRQIRLYPPHFSEDTILDEEKCFVPDFAQLSMLYKEFGINNDIDLALQKPQYKDIINSRMSEVPVNPSPNLDDSTLMDNMVSRELDANELREYAISQAKQVKKD